MPLTHASDSLPATVIIVGAGRSGTNMLRDVLCRLPGWGTWPCDEINYIWRHGNVSVPTDELTAAQARPDVRRYIRRAFRKIAQAQSVEGVIEKTCANALRVSFVHAVVPEAKFLHIVRDGRDVVASAMKRWSAPLDLPYVLRKGRYVPASDLPFYAARYFRDRLQRARSDDGWQAPWGPRFEGMQKALRENTLVEVCAHQWQRCVEKAAADLAQLDPAQAYQVRYEDFVQAPVHHLANICTFLGVETDSVSLPALVDVVNPSSVGRGLRDLSAEDVLAVERLAGSTLHALAYAI